MKTFFRHDLQVDVYSRWLIVIHHFMLIVASDKVKRGFRTFRETKNMNVFANTKIWTWKLAESHSERAFLGNWSFAITFLLYRRFFKGRF